MNPLGNVGQTTQTIDRNYEDPKTKETINSKTIIKGNTGLYQEIAKKKVGYDKSGTTVNFFDNARNPRKTDKGISVFIDDSGVSYLHWRNRHIFFDVKSMMPIKLQMGNFNPDSHAWFKMFVLKFLEASSKSTSTPPVRSRNTNTTLIMVAIAMFAIGYFVAIIYGQQLSPALFHNVTTSLSSTNSTVSSVSSILSSHSSNSSSIQTTVTVINGQTITSTTIIGAVP